VTSPRKAAVKAPKVKARESAPKGQAGPAAGSGAAKRPVPGKQVPGAGKDAIDQDVQALLGGRLLDGTLNELGELEKETGLGDSGKTRAMSILRETLAEDVKSMAGEIAGRAKPARAKAAKIAPPAGQALADLVVSAAGEHKISSPVLLDLTGLSSVADFFYIASADSPRQVRTVAEKIVRRAKEAGVRPLGHEGLSLAETRWALIDLGAVVAHVFMPEARSLYDLEGLWADAPRLGAVARRAARSRAKS
jgi:ribosome-associated protein